MTLKLTLTHPEKDRANFERAILQPLLKRLFRTYGLRCVKMEVEGPEPEPDEECDYCKGTGFYGDHGPGIRGHNEYTECTHCQKPEEWEG